LCRFNLLSFKSPEKTEMQQLQPLGDRGRLLSLDLGIKRVGAAVSDEMRISARPLPYLERRSWKRLLSEVIDLIEGFDAQGLVLGLPLMMDGSEGEAAVNVRRLYRNFQASLRVPVFLQDERLTSRAAYDKLRQSGADPRDFQDLIDSEAAVIILEDFIESLSRH
jgi:putative Holliday junction resolvase